MPPLEHRASAMTLLLIVRCVELYSDSRLVTLSSDINVANPKVIFTTDKADATWEVGRKVTVTINPA